MNKQQQTVNQAIWERLVFARSMEQLKSVMILLTLNDAALPEKQYTAISDAINARMARFTANA